MAYELTFSHQFTVGDRDHYINDCCFGGDLIVQRLLPAVTRSGGDHVETNQEDWGWFIWFRRDSLRLSIDVTCQDLDSGSFAIHVGARRPRRWFGFTSVDAPELDELRDQVMRELRAWLGVDAQVRRLDPDEIP